MQSKLHIDGKKLLFSWETGAFGVFLNNSLSALSSKHLLPSTEFLPPVIKQILHCLLKRNLGFPSAMLPELSAVWNL